MLIRIWRLILCLGLITFLALASLAQDNSATPGNANIAAQASASGNSDQQHQTPTAAQPGAQSPVRPNRLHFIRKHEPNPLLAPFFAPAGTHLTYFGGPVISNVDIVQVLYGAGSYAPEIAGITTPSLSNFYSDITNSGFMDMLSEYNTPAVGGTGQTIGHGTFDGLFQIVPSAANDGFLITDDQIQAELLAQISAGHLPAPLFDATGNPNTLYMIFFPNGQEIFANGAFSCQNFCAYHGTTNATFNLKPVLYGVHPDMQAGTGCDFGCGTSTPFGNITAVTSHELAEAMTDADVAIATVFGPPLGWIDGNTGEEIGDICAFQDTLYVANGTTYNLQTEFSNAANNCIGFPVTKPADFTLAASSLAIAAPGSGTSTVTVFPSNGFTGPVTLSFSALPNGVTASFGTNPTTSTSILTFTASSTAAAGTSNITITGISGTLTHTAVLQLTIGASQPQQLLGNPGFENGNATAPWALTAGVINNNTSAEKAHSGNWYAWLDGYGRTHTDTATQTVSIPSTATSATLSFWLHIDTAEITKTAANDTLQVQVLNSSGAVAATLGTFSNLNAAAGYQQHSFSMIGFKGQTVKIRFLGQENSSRQTSFVIDDTALNVQ